MEKPTRLALLKEIAEFLNEETELQSMLDGALDSLIKEAILQQDGYFY